MGDQTGGMGSEVGVRKIDEDGETTETRGFVEEEHHRAAYLILLTLLVLSLFGVWKIIEIVGVI